MEAQDANSEALKGWVRQLLGESYYTIGSCGTHNHTLSLWSFQPSRFPPSLTKAEHSEGGQKCLSSEREWRATKRRRKGGKQCESRLPPRQEQSGQKYRNTSSPIIFSTCVNLKGEKKRIKNSKGWKEEEGENKSRGAEVMCYQQRAFQRTVLSQMRRWCVWACGFATQQRQGWCVCKVNPRHHLLRLGLRFCKPWWGPGASWHPAEHYGPGEERLPHKHTQSYSCILKTSTLLYIHTRKVKFCPFFISLSQ